MPTFSARWRSVAARRPVFAQDALAALNQVLQVGSWPVYRVWADRPPASPAPRREIRVVP